MLTTPPSTPAGSEAAEASGSTASAGRNAVIGEDAASRIAELEAKLAQCTAQLECTRKELETFSFSISHDLRAPLRSIAGFTRIIAERHSANLDAEGQRLLGITRSEAARMAKLIEDILTFSRVSRQGLEQSCIDMTDLVRCTFQQLGESNPAMNARLELGELPMACGDRAMLRQVLVNLIGNAVKFSSRHPAPVIEVTGRREDDRSIYRIKDNGVGFDPRYAHRLFGVFQRLHRQDEFEGTGIGLALVLRILQRHGGSVWAEGDINAGATFSFALPLRHA